MLALPTPLGSAARDAFHRKAPKSRLLEAVDEYAKSAQAMIPLEGPVDINNPAASRGPPKAAIRREVDTVEPSGAHDTELALESAIDTGENNAEVQFASLNRGDRVPAATSSARTSQPPVVVRARGGLRGDDRGDSEWPDRFYEADDEGGNDHKTGQGDDRGQRGRNAGNPRTQQPKNSTGYGNYYEHGDRVGTGYTGTPELGLNAPHLHLHMVNARVESELTSFCNPSYCYDTNRYRSLKRFVGAQRAAIAFLGTPQQRRSTCSGVYCPEIF